MVVGKLNTLYKSDKPRIRVPSVLLDDILDVAKLQFPLNPVSYFYKKDIQQRVGPFPIENYYAMDYWFLLRAYKIATVRFLDQVLGNFHQHGDNKTATFGKTQLALLDVLQVFCRENGIDATRYVRNLFEKMIAVYDKELSSKEQIAQAFATAKKSLIFRLGRKIGLIKV